MKDVAPSRAASFLLEWANPVQRGRANAPLVGISPANPCLGAGPAVELARSLFRQLAGLSRVCRFADLSYPSDGCHDHARLL